jgi:hypothetical protein
LLDPFKFLETADAHHFLNFEGMVPETAEQVRASGMKRSAFGRELL